jgi:hypothetical protein
MKLEHIKVEHVWAVVFFTVALHRRSADVDLLRLEASGGVNRRAGQRRAQRA